MVASSSSSSGSSSRSHPNSGTSLSSSSSSMRFVLLSMVLALPLALADKGRADHYLVFDPLPKYVASGSLGEDNTRSTDFADPHIFLSESPHFTVQDQDNALGDCYTDSSECKVKLETFVRIRDPRIMSNPGTITTFPSTCPARQHIPIAGNLQHTTATSTVDSPAGFQLSCKWDNGPMCCFDVYAGRTVVDLSATAVPCPESVCVPIESPVVSVTNGGTTENSLEWIHLSGFASEDGSDECVGGVQNCHMSITVQYMDGTRRIATKQASEISYTFAIQAKRRYPLRIGGQIRLNNLYQYLDGDEDDDSQYFFFKGDMDEIRLFTGTTASNYERADALGLAFESYGELDSCWTGNSLQDPILSIQVDEGSSTVSFISDASPGNFSVSDITTGTSGYSSLAYSSGRTYSDDASSPMSNFLPNQPWVPFVDNIKFAGTSDQISDDVCTATTGTPQCSTYMDRPALVTLGQNSQPLSEISLEQRTVTLSNGQTRTWDYWVLSEGRAGSVIEIGLEDLNLHDQVLFRDGSLFGTSTCPDGLLCLNLDQTVLPYTSAVFNTGLIWEIPGKTSQTFQSAPSIPAAARREDVDGLPSIVTPTVIPNCRSSGGGTSNCDGLIINWPNPNLTSPEYYERAPSGSGGSRRDNWFEHCPLDVATDDRYKLLCLEWFIPRHRGYPIKLEYQERMSCPSDTSDRILTALVFQYLAVISYEAPPEWLAVNEYPLLTAQKQATDLGLQAECEIEGSLHQVAVSKTLNLKFRARDRNLDDMVDIRPRDDPGLPNGAILHPAVDERARLIGSVITTASIYQRELEFKPSRLQLNTTYEVCFRAESYNNDGYVYPEGKGSTLNGDMYPNLPRVVRDRCVFIQVVVPSIKFVSADNGEGYRDTYSFTVGAESCSESVSFVASDLGNGGGPLCGENSDICGKYEVFMMKDPENPGPELLTLEKVSGGAGESEYRTSWTPRAGIDENAEGFYTCIIAFAQDEDGNILSQDKLCFTARVRKCKYCMADGETLQSVASRYGTDWLQVYMANPHIRDPDSVPPDDRLLNLGVLYTVRGGDYLELLSERFFQSVEGMRALNPDVPASGLITPGQQLCVIPPVCDVDCLYGTDCHIY